MDLGAVQIIERDQHSADGWNRPEPGIDVIAVYDVEQELSQQFELEAPQPIPEHLGTEQALSSASNYEKKTSDNFSLENGARPKDVLHISVQHEIPTQVSDKSENAVPYQQKELNDANKNNDNKLNEKQTLFRPKNAPDFMTSLKKACESVFWIAVHSTILGFLPLITIVVVFGSVWFFDINSNNVLWHLVISQSIFLFISYIGIAAVFLYIFGKKRALKLYYQITLPLSLLHIIIAAIRQVYILPLFSLVYYGIFLLHLYIFLKRVQASQKNNIISSDNERERRYETLSSDGTPLVLLKGVIFFGIVFYISANIFIPFLIDNSLIMKAFGRTLAIPFLFNLISIYANNGLLKKSKEFLKYRVILKNLMNTIYVCILRLMTTNPSNLFDTLLLSVLSSLFEIFSRSSFVLQMVYMMRLSSYWKENYAGFFTCFIKRQVIPLDQMAPNQPSSSAPLSSTGVSHKNPMVTNERPNAPRNMTDAATTSHRFRILMDRINRKDEVSEFAIYYQENRSLFLTMVEIQSSVFIPVVLFLCHPIRQYVTFQTFSTFKDMLVSMGIQLSAELMTQVTCISLESYLYGIQTKVSTSITYNLKWPVILQCWATIILAVSFSTFPFRPGPEKWSEQ